MRNLFPELVRPVDVSVNKPGTQEYRATAAELAYVARLTHYSYPPDNQDSWYYLHNNVEWHQDGEGACFVICMEGSGVLQLEYKTKPLQQYQFCVFDDRLPHCFNLTSPTCTLFVTNVRGRLNPQLRNSKNFVLGH